VVEGTEIITNGYEEMMWLMVAKVLQLMGILQVTFALVIGLRDEHGMKQELTFFLIGCVTFFGGWLLQKKVSR
jgi:hypothetical protein